jgi:hypothetical protein
VGLGDHGRVDAHGHFGPAVDQLGDGQQLDGVTQSRGVGDIGRADAADPLPVHVGVDDITAEGQGGEDGGLGRGIVAVDVGRRVALGQAERLRLAQDVVVVGALFLHAGEDVVGRAVDDAHDADDLLPRQ